MVPTVRSMPSTLTPAERVPPWVSPCKAGVELIPRPEQNPAVLAVVAADRLPEMVDGQTRAVAEAIETGSIQPIRNLVAHCAAVVEIERQPATAQAYHRANCLASHAETVAECREHAATAAEALPCRLRGGGRVAWSREHLPDQEQVAGGCPADLLAAVERRAAEFVRAEALHLDGTSYQGNGEPTGYLDGAAGLLTCLPAPSICRDTSHAGS